MIPETTSELPFTTPSPDEPVVENLIYAAKGKALLYTTEVPMLKIRGNKSSEDVTYSLEKHAIVTADEREGVFNLVIKFIVPEKTVSSIKFALNSCAVNQSSTKFKYFLDSHQVYFPYFCWKVEFKPGWSRKSVSW